jgi:hypothetical protein
MYSFVYLLCWYTSEKAVSVYCSVYVRYWYKK